MRQLLHQIRQRGDGGLCTMGCRAERDAPVGYARSVFDYRQNGLRRFSAATPHRTVRAVFPHTALRVGLVSSVSLPFASRLRFTLIPMDAPPYGRAVSDAPPPLPRAGPCGRLCRRLRRPPLRASPFGACALSHLNRVGAEVLVSRIQSRLQEGDRHLDAGIPQGGEVRCGVGAIYGIMPS